MQFNRNILLCDDLPYFFYLSFFIVYTLMSRPAEAGDALFETGEKSGWEVTRRKFEDRATSEARSVWRYRGRDNGRVHAPGSGSHLRLIPPPISTSLSLTARCSALSLHFAAHLMFGAICRRPYAPYGPALFLYGDNKGITNCISVLTDYFLTHSFIEDLSDLGYVFYFFSNFISFHCPRFTVRIE